MCRIEICIRRCKNAYGMFLRAEKTCFLSLLKNLLKPTYTSCVLDRRYVNPRRSTVACNVHFLVHVCLYM